MFEDDYLVEPVSEYRCRGSVEQCGGQFEATEGRLKSEEALFNIIAF